MTSILRQREIMYGGASKSSPKPGVAIPPKVAPQTAPAVANREDAGKRLYALSMKPSAEQKHYQHANAVFATPILKARSRGDMAKAAELEKARDQCAAVSYELEQRGVSDEDSKRLVSRVAHDVDQPMTRGHKLADAERNALIEIYGADKPVLTKMAEQLAQQMRSGKPEFNRVLDNCDAPAHLDVVAPFFEVAAKMLASERTTPEPQTQSTEIQT